MSGLDPNRISPALEPVRAELLRRANAEAQQVIADAEGEAQRIVENASHTARQLVDQARAAGEAAGARVAAIEEASLRRGLRREVLAAQEEAYRVWRRRAREAVLGLRDDPDYPRWKEALSRSARATLGDDARVVEDSAGGVLAQLGRRGLDLSLSAIADHAIDEIAPEADGLWL